MRLFEHTDTPKDEPEGTPSPEPVAMRLSSIPPAVVGTGVNATPTKVILDNDWSPVGFIPSLRALDAGWDRARSRG